MSRSIQVIEIGDKVISIQLKDFTGLSIDPEELFQVDYNNIIGDIITFPVLFNRIALLKAEMDSAVETAKFDFDVFLAQKYEEHKKKLGGITDGRVTEKSIEMSMIRDPAYAVKKNDLIKIQKQSGIMDALYNSARSKDRKLDSISTKLKPEEFESDILEGTINDVMIKIYKNNFPNKH